MTVEFSGGRLLRVGITNIKDFFSCLRQPLTFMAHLFHEKTSKAFALSLDGTAWHES